MNLFSRFREIGSAYQQVKRLRDIAGVLLKVPPMWGDVSVVGLAGYLLTGLMGFWLLMSIIRHGRM